MAIGIENYTNIDTSDPTNYPHGSIKDDPAGFLGTPVGRETYDDIQQTFRRALTLAGITPSGDPDNVGNGYQYSQGFGLEAWEVSAALTFTPTGGGTVTIDPADITYNKYKIVGKTLTYQLFLSNITIAGTVSTIVVTLPFLSGPLRNAFFELPGIYIDAGTRKPLTIALTSFVAPFNGITLSTPAGAFTTGVNNQTLCISIVAEI